MFYTTTFHCYHPKSKSQNGGGKISPDSSAKIQRYKILVVDDEEDVLELLKMTLESADQFDCRVFTGKDGFTGLETIKEVDIDLVISDYRMEDMDGVEFLKKVKEDYPDIIRMMITGYSELDLAKKAINEAQVYNYIEKPWDNEDIRLAVFEALKEREEEREEEKEPREISFVDGNSYILEGERPVETFEYSLERMKKAGEGLIISRKHPDKIKERFGTNEEDLDIEYFWLTRTSGQNNMDPAALELIADRVIRYFEGGGKTVLVEGVGALLRDNSFKRFVGFVDNIVDVASVENGCFMIALDPRIIDDKELAYIEEKMGIVDFRE